MQNFNPPPNEKKLRQDCEMLFQYIGLFACDNLSGKRHDAFGEALKAVANLAMHYACGMTVAEEEIENGPEIKIQKKDIVAAAEEILKLIGSQLVKSDCLPNDAWESNNETDFISRGTGDAFSVAEEITRRIKNQQPCNEDLKLTILWGVNHAFKGLMTIKQPRNE